VKYANCDRYTNASTPDRDSLECWVSLVWLAGNTKRIQFGTLVSPFSFRHPTMLARMGRDVDDLSGGRFTLGLGAGWQAREHANYGWDLLEPKERFKRFEDGLEVVTRLLKSDEPVSFLGKYYHVQDAVLLPRPARRGGPPILIGGNGMNKTLAFAAKYASEWNATFQTADNYANLNKHLDQLLAKNGRKPTEVRRSMMTGCVFGRDDIEVQRKVSARNRTFDELRERGIAVGTASQVVDQLGQLAEACVQRIMLQWLDLDDLDGLEGVAKSVMPQLK
jgi:alkanesulfonate monooxygenase SsuD/methylene tetrahydromethanopterin reductase-like flavin-dependent oxidoreductase (luciferase family)